MRISHKQTVQQHRSPGGRDKIYWHAFERKPDGGIRPGRLRAPVPESGAVRLDILGVFAAQTLIVNVVYVRFSGLQKKRKNYRPGKSSRKTVIVYSVLIRRVRLPPTKMINYCTVFNTGVHQDTRFCRKPRWTGVKRKIK